CARADCRVAAPARPPPSCPNERRVDSLDDVGYVDNSEAAERWPAFRRHPLAARWLNLQVQLGLAPRTVDAERSSEPRGMAADAIADVLGTHTRQLGWNLAPGDLWRTFAKARARRRSSKSNWPSQISPSRPPSPTSDRKSSLPPSSE